MAIQRYLEGVGSVSAANPIGMLPYLDPTTWCVWMEDFVVIPELTSQWVHTVSAGSTLAAASTGGCGIVLQTNAGSGDNELCQLTLKNINFTLASAKKLIFEAKVYIDKGAAGTLGQSEIFVGLAALETAGNFTHADGLVMTSTNTVGFWSADAATTFDCLVRVADVESIQAAPMSYTDVTWMTLSFYFDGTSVTFYKNDAQIATISAFPTAGLTPTLYIKNGEAKPSALWTDYVLVARER